MAYKLCNRLAGASHVENEDFGVVETKTRKHVSVDLSKLLKFSRSEMELTVLSY